MNSDHKICILGDSAIGKSSIAQRYVFNRFSEDREPTIGAAFLSKRIGLVNFLDGIGVDVDPNMVATPRESSYVRLDDWDQEAIKWYEKKKANT